MSKTRHPELFSMKKPLATSTLYWALVGYFESGLGDKELARYQRIATIPIKGDQSNREAARIYLDNLSKEYVILHQPAKDMESDAHLQTALLSDIDEEVTNYLIEKSETLEDSSKKIRRYYPVCEVGGGANHYVLAMADGAGSRVIDSMVTPRVMAYPDKKLLDFLKKWGGQQEITKSRNWQMPTNDWACGYYVIAELMYQEALKNKPDLKHKDIFALLRSNQKIEQTFNEYASMYELGVSTITDNALEASSTNPMFDVDADDDFDAFLNDTDNENNGFSDSGLLTDDVTLPSLPLTIVPPKKSFAQRHPLATGALIGGGLVLLGLIALAVVVGTGGLGVPALVGVSAVVSGLISSSITLMGLGLTIAASIGSGLAALGITAFFGGLVGFALSDKKKNQQVASPSQDLEPNSSGSPSRIRRALNKNETRTATPAVINKLDSDVNVDPTSNNTSVPSDKTDASPSVVPKFKK